MTDRSLTKTAMVCATALLATGMVSMPLAQSRLDPPLGPVDSVYRTWRITGTTSGTASEVAGSGVIWKVIVSGDWDNENAAPRLTVDGTEVGIFNGMPYRNLDVGSAFAGQTEWILNTRFESGFSAYRRTTRGGQSITVLYRLDGDRF